jgi:tRNA(adenine34) deaminase
VVDWIEQVGVPVLTSVKFGGAMWSDQDDRFIERTVELAIEAEKRGDAPVGSVITLGGEVVAEGSARILSEGYQPRRHAEQEALGNVPVRLWPRAGEMTCYTSLEPCLMCFGSLLLCGVGRVVFGATDVRGGARFVFDSMPPYYANGRGRPTWVGPVLPEVCDALYQRVDSVFRTLPCG